MNITEQQLREIAPFAPKNAGVFIPYLNQAMDKYEINTPRRAAAFLAQIAHESGSFRYVRELADGSAYEGRKDLGNTHSGDGKRYKGRGLIQITGRSNYLACGKALGADFVNNPDLLSTPSYACLSAGWFWQIKELNELADAGDFIKITKRINGGINGLSERLAFYQKAKNILEV